MKTKTKPTSAPQPVAYGWEDDALEVPRGFEPDLGRIGRTREFYRRFVRISVFWQWLSFLLLLILLYAMVVKPQDAAEQQGAVSATSSSPGRAAATLALNQWLASSPAPLPRGQVISWDGSKDIPPATTVDKDGNTITYPSTSEVDNFTVMDGSGVLYTASINVAVDPRGGTKVLAGPSLIPVAPAISDDWASASGPWPGLTEAGQTTPAIETAVDAWMKAMISGDPEALRVAVGDPNVENTYTPMHDVASAKNAITFLAQKPEQPGVLIGRLETTLTWKGVPTPKDAATKQAPPAVFDVLIERADTGAPVVTAWGAPGTGATLSRYGNAAPGQRASSDPTAAPAAPAPAPAAPAAAPAAPAAAPAPTSS